MGRIREQHAARRKMMSRNFAQGPLMELVPQFMKKTEALCQKIEGLGTGTVNIYPWLHRLGLEFIRTSTSFSESTLLIVFDSFELIRSGVVMQTLGYDPELTENNTHHPELRELEVFPENFAMTAIFPFLKKYGVHVPIASINRSFRIQAGWVKVRVCGFAIETFVLKSASSAWVWSRKND